MPPAPPQETSLLATFVQKCAAANSVRQARQLHALLLTSTPSLPESSFLHNNILSMYARCGSFADSQHLFDKMPQRNIVSYNTLISAYSRSPGHAQLAFQLFNQLEIESFASNGLTMTSLLRASGALEDRVIGSSLHAHCIKLGFLNNVIVETSLIGMYSSCGDVDCAKKAFCNMRDKDDMAWNTIISCYVKNGKVMGSLQLFQNMLKDLVYPTQFTYSLVLNGCAKLEDYVSGRILHAQLLVSGTYIDLPLQNALLDMYCSCGDTNTAFNHFSRIKNPDLVSWNSIIGGYSENGDGEMAMYMFIKLNRLSPLKPDEYTFAAVISGTTGSPAFEYGKPLHAQTEKTGFVRSLYIGSTLISMYFNNDDSVSSQKIFDSFLHKDEVQWTDMIAGYVRIGESWVALKLFHEMFGEGYNLDSFMLSSAVSASADLAILRQGEMIHSLVVKTGNESETCVHGSLVDMYAKNGELKSAAYIFSCLTTRDLKCWNSMLTGYGNHGEASKAFQIFYEMIKHGLKPDHVTFLSLLCACSHCGLVEKAKFFWNYMNENSLKPGPKHYSCMLSLLTRAGLWEETEKILNELPFISDSDYLELWRTILSNCMKNGNLRIGIHAAEMIRNRDLENSAVHILAMKLYASLGRWNDVSETRRKMRILEKEPGLSWIDVKNNIEVFCSGDRSHPQSSEIRVMLRKLMGNLIPTGIR